MKVKHLIFLEDHSEPFQITPIVKKWLGLEGKLAVLTENRPYSKQNMALQKYASSLRQDAGISRQDFIEVVKGSKDYYQHCLERQIELVEFAAALNQEFAVVPLDIRSSKKAYSQFKVEDILFRELCKKYFDLSKKEIQFFEEHALGAWYTGKTISRLEKEGFSSFVYSVGYSHYASLARYLMDKSCHFVFLPKSKPVNSYYRMIAFFLPECSGDFCVHCGGDIRISNS